MNERLRQALLHPKTPQIFAAIGTVVIGWFLVDWLTGLSERWPLGQFMAFGAIWIAAVLLVAWWSERWTATRKARERHDPSGH